MMALSNRLPLRLMKPAFCFRARSTVRMTSGERISAPAQFSPIVLPFDGHGAGMGKEPGAQEFADHRGDAARMVIVLAQIFARRLQVDEQRNGVADPLPVVVVERDARGAWRWR